ncbi:MAG: hypothetical protein DRQ49_13895 [Gammaproteobacteria bacterium]|nr:MAG: hypothetical protein DRQ49_13895 [Gammaproteobacteria bacterium]RKZ73782.1 MAG: hypothetical protein DRQ57_13250 [Gammaproteobacteria bacterium]
MSKNFLGIALRIYFFIRNHLSLMLGTIVMQAINFLPLNMIFTFPPLIQIVYFSFCFLVGLFGRKKKMGFWGYFFFSTIFSPILGTLVLIIT